MLGALVRDGFRTVPDPDGADVAVINTCAFLQSAVRESKAAIAGLAELRRRNRLRGLIVTGCLAQRAGESLLEEFPQVDAVLERDDGSVVGIEVKTGATLSGRDWSGLRSLRDAAGSRFRRGILLYAGAEALSFGPDLVALPLAALWSVEDVGSDRHSG